MAKNELTYEKAYNELQQIVENLQSEAVSIDELSKQALQAKELLEFCKEKLRKTKEEVKTLFD